MAASRTIADLRKGETAVISRIIDNDLALKLLEMGCLPGEPVVLQHVAPLGDPVCIRISGYSLSLRKREAASIQLVMDHETVIVTKPALSEAE